MIVALEIIWMYVPQNIWEKIKMDLCDKVCFELFNFDVSSGSTGCNVWALNDLLIPGACLRPDMPGIGETNTLEKRKQLQKWGQALSK